MEVAAESVRSRACGRAEVVLNAAQGVVRDSEAARNLETDGGGAGRAGVGVAGCRACHGGNSPM